MGGDHPAGAGDRARVSGSALDLDPAPDRPRGARSSRWSPGGRSSRAAAAPTPTTPASAGPAAGEHRRPVGVPPLHRPAPQAAVLAAVRPVQPRLELGVEVRRRGEGPARQERRLQIAVGALDQALGLRIPRLALDDPDPERPAERLELSVSFGLPARHDPTADSLSQTNAFGTAPSRCSSSQCPAIRSGACREGSITAVITRECPATITSTGGRPDCPNPSGDVDRREPQVALRQPAR